MPEVGTERDRTIEKDFFDLPVRDAMLCPVLPYVPVVPVASFPLGRVKFHHERCIP
jgi:hypothetical protein